MPGAVPPRALIIASHDHEDLEAWYPWLRLREMGVTPVVASLARGKLQGRQGLTLPVDATIYEAGREEWPLVIVAGGLGADELRAVGAVHELLSRQDQAGRPIAVMGHGLWLLASAGLLDGRRVTGPASIRADLQHAGAQYEDGDGCHVDGNLVTGRGPLDVADVMREALRLVAQRPNLGLVGEAVVRATA